MHYAIKNDGFVYPALCVEGFHRENSYTYQGVPKIFNVAPSSDPIDLSQLETDSISHLTIGIPQEFHCPGLDQEILDAWSKVIQVSYDYRVPHEVVDSG